jgi:hypothetical protein
VTFIALKKTSDIRIWDLSSGGCLFESREQLPIGTVGLLHVDLDGQRRREWFRICRVHADEGRRGTCLLGAEFLPLAPAGRDSLRRAAGDLRTGGGMAGIPGRSSGDPGNFAGSGQRANTRRRRNPLI